MNALIIASLRRWIALAVTWTRARAYGMIHVVAATAAWQHTAAFAAVVVQKISTAALIPARPRPHERRRMLPVRSAPVFPIRVIDVEETLGSTHGGVAFSEPTSWEFHTISHTWSKGVQSWSDSIARKMQERNHRSSCSTGEATSSYNDLFRCEDFRSHECYSPFMEFLKLLRADGVKHVWLDALCINQGSETGEKSQELQNMGSYYAKSLGCYVCAHGFGEGFETWKEKESELVMPRWFNRVWTFQEMLLPTTLTFILDIHPIIRRTINWSIAKQAAEGVNGPCMCAIGLRAFPQPRYLVGEEEEGGDEEEEEDRLFSGNSDYVKKRGMEIICQGKPCCRCRGAALIRRAKDHRLLLQQSHTSTADLYFIDRKCIFRLMIMAKEQLERTLWKHCEENVEWKLLRLETLMQQRDAEREELNLQDLAWDPIQVVVEISKRDCTHDEDRVLSVLGVLGLEGAVQLRAGKTLDAQLIDLAQQLVSVNPTALLKLCVAQFAGHSTPGMSWAPSLGARGGLRTTGEDAPTPTWKELHHDQHIYARQMKVEEVIESGLLQLGQVMRHFVRKVQVQNVLDNGSLLLSQARVLQGCFFVRVDQNTFNFEIKRADYSLKEFQFQAYFSPSSCLLRHNIFVAGHITLINQSMVRLEGEKLSEKLDCFEVCLLLLGELNLPSDEKNEVMMVCIGDKLDCLHKVGLAWLPGLNESLFDKDPPNSMCTIGGFPDYMDRFVLKMENCH